MSTLKDVAKRAGVSIATVSYCLNNTKTVKAATRDKIMQAIEELNYIPNASAKSLKSESSKMFGVIFPDIDDLFYSEILEGIVANAENKGYSLNISFSYNSPKQERKLINQFIGKNIDGLILITCQPGNSEYFEKSIVRNNIPTVFLEHFPNNIDANFLGFDNYNTCYSLTNQLIEKGYSNIMLISGYKEFFSERECLRGFSDAYEDLDLALPSGRIVELQRTKEAAFRKSMLRIVNAPPEAIITSSQQIAKGIVEAFNLCNIRIPQETCIITLGEECWNESNYLPNLLHTSRTAYTLGKYSVEVLIKNLAHPTFFEKAFMLFKDNVIDNPLQIPEAPKPVSAVRPPKRTLRILSPSLPTMLSLHAISKEFEKQHDIKIDLDFVDYHQMITKTVDDAKTRRSDYDLYLFDVSWMEYLANMNVLTDLTDFMLSQKIFQKNLIPENLSNACYKGRYYGFPIVGGSYILFYRKDLFEQPSIQKQFESQHSLPLRPPKTWKEFNGIAQFFTKEFNSYSPTLYGTSVIGNIHEELTLELLIRLWSFGGGFYDNTGKIKLNTPQNIKAFQSLLESCRFSERPFFETSIDDSFRAFGSGRTAMLLSFTEYGSLIDSSLEGNIISKIGYSMLPGNTPVKIGWNMGVSKTTPHMKLISEYFKWICKKKTSYYMTTLNGQSTVSFPYENHEILKLYPWMEINDQCLRRTSPRVYPFQGRNRLVPPYEVEMILYTIFLKMYHQELSIPDALTEGEGMFRELFR